MRARGLVGLLAVACLGVGTTACSGLDKSDDASPSTTATAGGQAGELCSVDPSISAGRANLEVDFDGATYQVERVMPTDPTDPADPDGSGRHPLIIDLHGFTSTIEQQDLYTNLPAEAPQRGYVLLTPQAQSATIPVGSEQIEAPFWNVFPELSAQLQGTHDDVGFITKLIDDSVSELCVDESRIYLTGFSNGAAMTVAMACALGERIAAIAPVSGANLAPSCDDPAPVSVIAFHGDADPLVDYAGGATATMPLDNPSMGQRMGQFAAAAGCSAEADESKPFDDIVLRRWSGCADGTDVELYTVVGGGHTWPGMFKYVNVAQLATGGDTNRLAQAYGVDLLTIAGHMTTNIEATSLMLDFFDSHTRA